MWRRILNIIWSKQARFDLREIHLHILMDNPNAARKLYKRIQDTILLLNENPDIGRLGRVPGTREMIVSGTRYIIPYQVNQNTLQILRVYHAARQWPEVF